MIISQKTLEFSIRLCRFNFGTFEKEEFKKFLRMGLMFALIVGVYWSLRVLKDSIFIQLADKMQLPYAKTASVLALLPVVIFYTKLLERTSRERLLVLLPAFYGCVILCFSVAMAFAQASPEEIAARSLLPFVGTKILGYAWYIFVESFGSLVFALFWSFATDTTVAASAKRGFPLVIALGQMGGILCPYGITGLPHRLGLANDVLSIVILGALTFSIIPIFRYFLRVTPKNQMKSFHGKNEQEEEKKQEPGFFSGLKLVLSHKYLLGMFAVNFIYEIIVTIFDFNFKLAASTHCSGVHLSHYLSLHASSVNVVSFLLLLLGISNVTRYVGVNVALALMPVIVGLALFGFLTIDSLSFLFVLMVGARAINYALNGPALKQLYIPTTTDVRFKAQAWIETFGSRTSKETGSLFNMLLQPLQNVFGEIAGKSYYLILNAGIGFPLIGLWFITALYLGNRFQKAILEEKVVC